MIPPVDSPWRWTGGRPDLAAMPTRMNRRVSDALPALDDLLDRLEEAQRKLHANGRHGVLLIVQGLDASGKDSLFRTLARGLDPAGFRVWSFGVPDREEAAHDFLWRAVRRYPARGEVVGFNRSQYEAVLAERQLPGAPSDKRFWKHRFEALRHAEHHLVVEGTAVIKVWLHLSREEQRLRLLKRLDEPRKRWKFDPSDLDTFARRDSYLDAVAEAVQHTHHDDAPWHLVPADDKPEARRAVADLLARTLEALAPAYPATDAAIDAAYRRLLG